MKVIKPTTMTSGALVSTTATETVLAWNSATSYALNDRALLTSTNLIYACIQTPCVNKDPATQPLYWSTVGPTNKWAMFDSQVSTATTATTTLTVVLDTGFVNSLAMVGLVGSSVTVSATDGAAGPTVYSTTVALDGAIILDWYQYFFEPFNTLSEIALTNIPTYTALRITATITGSSVAVGNLIFGTSYDLGMTEASPNIGIIDYSRKDTNSTTGVTTFAVRSYSKRMSVRSMIDTASLNKVQRVLTDVRATPCMWIGSDDTTTYAPLAIYGFYRDFSIDIAYATKCFCSLEIEGLT